MADDEAFCQLVWAVDALQSDREQEAKRYIQFPKEAATTDFASGLAVHKWELETLITQLLTIPKAKPGKRRQRFANCAQFRTAARAVNYLRRLEDEEASIYLERLNVLSEVHRIGQRQFPWQRGHAYAQQFYRYAYIYGHGRCKDYFEKTYAVSLNHFSLIGFALFAGLQRLPAHSADLNLEKLNVSNDDVRAALKLLVAPISSARAEAPRIIQEVNEKHGSEVPVAYRPSYLRLFPVIAFGKGGERLRAPLPDMIALRITSGVYYDLVSGPPQLRNEASDRFEQYCTDYISEMLPRYSVSRERRYGVRKRQFDTPDIRINYEGKVAAVIECKATRLSYAAQFTEDPFFEAQRAYDEIAKGVFQLWRFFSHARRSIYTADSVSPDAHGLILTLDTWLVMSRPLQDQVISAAGDLADEDPGISELDRRPVAFCSIADLEHILARADEESFLRAMAAASNEQRFIGWQLRDVHRDMGNERTDPKPFPFELGQVLPWWSLTESLRAGP